MSTFLADLFTVGPLIAAILLLAWALSSPNRRRLPIEELIPRLIATVYIACFIAGCVYAGLAILRLLTYSPD
jgi:hypothetical protein